MKLIRIQIQGYKTLSDIDIKVDDMLVLIGENNTGKSNILEALDKFFNPGKITLGKEYFCAFGEDCNEIRMTLTFSNLTEEEKEQFRMHMEDDILRVRRIATRLSANEGGELDKFLSVVRQPIDPLLNVQKSNIDSAHVEDLKRRYTLPSYTHGTKGEPTVTKVKDNWERVVEDLSPIQGMSSEFRESTILGYTAVAQSSFPKYEWLPAVRDATDETKTSQKSRFGEIFGEVLEQSSSAEFAQRITDLLNQIQEALNTTARNSIDDQTNPLIDLERELNELFNQHMSGTSISLSFEVPDLKKIMRDGSRVEIDDGVKSGLEHKGHGMQRLFIFMLLRVYAKRKAVREDREQRRFILAIEEPELYLHPPAQRQLLQVLKIIAPEQQVLICTHSPYFIDMSNYYQICIASRESRTSPTRLIQSTDEVFSGSEKEEFHLLSRLDPTRSEVFFSKRVILVEGDTERMTIPIIGERLGVNFPLEGITVIEAGGKTSMPFFMKIMNIFGIKYLVIYDEDPVNPDEINKDKKREAQRIYEFNMTILNSVGQSGNCLMVEGNFEVLLGVSRNQMDRKGKALASYKKINEIQISEISEYFIHGLKEFLELHDD